MSQIWKEQPSAAGLVGPGTPRNPPFLYRTLRGAVRPVLARWFDFEVSGGEHVPGRGPFIVAANHANYLDGVVLSAALAPQVAYLVMPRVFHATPLHPLLHRRLGNIPVSLTRPDPGAIRRALRVLEAGGVLGIFPEGPFGRDGQLVPGQPGIALVALRAGVPVVPAAITGTFEALAGRRLYLPRRVPLRVRFGPPLDFGERGRPRPTQRVRQDVTGRIMEEIAGLLRREPLPAGRGVCS
jgi:1-acyl-sn-glycerol-3-phosphate acyltransferase